MGIGCRSVAPDGAQAIRAMLPRRKAGHTALAALPAAHKLSACRSAVAKGLVSSGGHEGMSELNGVSEVTSDGQALEALAESGEARLRSLGLRLNSAHSDGP